MWLDAEIALCHLDRLYAAARGLTGNHADADDLVQDVFVALLRRPRKLNDRAPMAYLTVMLRNAHIDRHRAATRRQGFPLHEAEEAEDTRSTLRPDRAAEHRDVMAAVGSLDAPFRETVVAVDVVGLSYKEAAGALGVPIGTVMSRLARGRRRVVGLLDPMPQVAPG
jgi:RNA polymerase sigma-70 factor (ECF subfamily)